MAATGGEDPMQAYAAMLDVLRESQPEQYADIMAQLQASAGGPVGAGQGERINPEPSFVIKTATVPTDRGAVRGGTKVFINVTHAAQVPGFRKRRDLSGSEAVEGLHVPIAIGPPRTDVDRAGRPCSVYDVVVNPEVTSGCVSRGGEAFRHMVCGIVMQNVEAKFGRKASPPWTLNEAYRLPTLANRYKDVGRVPDSDTSFPEDRFHVKDPLSLHFLQERERAKAEAEQKQLAKEAAAGPATAAQKAPAPAEYDLESEADLGLL